MLLQEAAEPETQEQNGPGTSERGEYDEIEEIRRFSSELNEPEPASFTIA